MRASLWALPSVLKAVPEWTLLRVHFKASVALADHICSLLILHEQICGNKPVLHERLLACDPRAVCSHSPLLGRSAPWRVAGEAVGGSHRDGPRSWLGFLSICGKQSSKNAFLNVVQLPQGRGRNISSSSGLTNTARIASAQRGVPESGTGARGRCTGSPEKSSA